MQRTLGDYIKERREGLGLNQTQLAERSGVPRETINRLENNKTMLPSADSRRRLADALRVSHLDMLVAAGEITTEELTTTGKTGAIKRTNAVVDKICALAEPINWELFPGVDKGIMRTLEGLAEAQQARRRRDG